MKTRSVASQSSGQGNQSSQQDVQVFVTLELKTADTCLKSSEIKALSLRWVIDVL